jgi:hypothetical protein
MHFCSQIPRCIFGPFFYTLLIFCVVGLNGGVLGFLALCVPVMMCAASATAYGKREREFRVTNNDRNVIICRRLHDVRSVFVGVDRISSVGAD